jgi:hypothetical protein
MIMGRFWSTGKLGLVLAVGCLAGCATVGPPSQRAIERAALQTWDSRCAASTEVDELKVDKGRWRIAEKVYAVDVQATFRVVADCESPGVAAPTPAPAPQGHVEVAGPAEIGKQEYEKKLSSFEKGQIVPFQKEGLELVRCAESGEWLILAEAKERCGQQ